MKLNRNLEDVRENTVNDCFYCEKDSKDCSICVWRNRLLQQTILNQCRLLQPQKMVSILWQCQTRSL